MYKIFYDNEQFAILLDGEQSSSGMLELEADKNYVLTLLPIYDKTLFLPISSNVKIKNNNLVCNIPHIKIDKTQFYLTPKFAPYIPPSNPHVDIQREFGEHTITVYTDNIPKLLIENASNFISVLLPEYPDKLQEAVLDNGVLFYCLCPHYLCIVLYDYNDYFVLVDKQCDSYEFDENGISLTVTLNDNQGRIYHCHLKFEDKQYICDNDYFEYKSPHTPHEKLVGYDFLQAILADDIDYAQKLLSPNCKNSFEDIQNMLEDMQNILIPKCPINKNCVYITLAEKMATCRFNIQNGLIESVITTKQ